MDHHHHAHSHGHHQSGVGQKNQEHFDKVAATVFDTPWIQKLCSQISDELRDQVDWIGFPKKNTENKENKEKKFRMLDYACGNGLASRALAPYVDTIRGIDISSGMVEQYNMLAKKNGYDSSAMHAVHGDFVDARTNPSVDLNGPEFSDFDLIAMSMALHHVEDPKSLIKTLSRRLRGGGVLLIIDWVSASESGCSSAGPPAGEPVSHTVACMGFERRQLDDWFANAGLKAFGWKWFSSQSELPGEMGGLKQGFLARAMKA